MPVRLKKLKGGKYRVTTPSGTKARATTKAKAEGLRRLLYGLEQGMKPRK